MHTAANLFRGVEKDNSESKDKANDLAFVTKAKDKDIMRLMVKAKAKDTVCFMGDF